MLNFVGIDYRRRFDKEYPGRGLYISDQRTFNPETGTVAAMEPPMHFEITFQFSIYNNSNRERDKMLHKIFQMFPRGGCSLLWYPDPDNHPNVFLYMPLRIDETFVDETDIEGLDEKETRDIIKTNFNIVSSAVVPYDVIEFPAVSRVLIDHDLTEEYSDGTIITINNSIEGNAFHHIYYASSRSTLKLNGYNSFALDDKWYYTHKSVGKLQMSGSAITA